MSRDSIRLSSIGSLRIGSIWHCSIVAAVLSGFFDVFFLCRYLLLLVIIFWVILIPASVLVEVVSSIDSLIATRLWYVSLVNECFLVYHRCMKSIINWSTSV